MLKNVSKVFLSKLKKKAEKQLLSVNLGSADIAIDCGANVGDITEYLAKTGATVYSFEPNPHAYAVLRKRFSMLENVYCINKGVGDFNKKMKLYMHMNSKLDEIYWSTGSSLLDFKGNIDKNNFVEVDIIDLSEFIANLNNRVKILKLDVEGVEVSILNKLINRGVHNCIDYIFVETHDHKIPALVEETNLLRKKIKNKGISNISLDWQ